MNTSAELHMACKLANAPVLPFPFSHMLVHAIEPITEVGVRRDLLLYDIMIEQPQQPPQQVTTANSPKA